MTQSEYQNKMSVIETEYLKADYLEIQILLNEMEKILEKLGDLYYKL